MCIRLASSVFILLWWNLHCNIAIETFQIADYTTLELNYIIVYENMGVVATKSRLNVGVAPNRALLAKILEITTAPPTLSKVNTVWL